MHGMCIDNGFSSVMIDGSMLAYEENVALTKSVVDYAKVNMASLWKES
jgi:fructose/tagatose bisphosphate aldolase